MSEAADTRKLHPVTAIIRALESLPQFVLGLIGGAYFVADTGVLVALVFGLGGVLLSVLFGYIYWLRFSYSISDEELVIESGVLSRNRRTIPFDRIQDVSLEQNLLARLFGVSIARVETGSAGSDEGELSYVNAAESARLRDAIRRYRADVQSGADAGESEAETSEPVLFAANFGRNLLDGLFNFSLVFLAIFGGAYQYFGSFVPDEVFDPRYWAGESGAAIIGMATLFNLVSIALLLIAIGFLTGIARTIAREFGFTLTRTESGLRRRRGLFTRTDVVIPLRRVQAAILTTGLFRRIWGWHSLALQSLGADGQHGTHHIVAPFARSDEARPILDEVSLPPPPHRDAFESVSPRMVLRRWLGAAVILAIAGVPLALFAPMFLWFGIVLIPIALAGPLLAYRAHGYCMRDDILFVRKGFWRPQVTIVELAKIQSATLVRGPFQRLFGLGTLVLGTAGGARGSPIAIEDLQLGTGRKLFAGPLFPRRPMPGDPATA